jgi:hypothetical protein
MTRPSVRTTTDRCLACRSEHALHNFSRGEASGRAGRRRGRGRGRRRAGRQLPRGVAGGRRKDTHFARGWVGSATRGCVRACVRVRRVECAGWPLAIMSARPCSGTRSIWLAGRAGLGINLGIRKSGGLGNKMRGCRMGRTVSGADCHGRRRTSQNSGTARCLEQTRFDSFASFAGAASCQREERLSLFHEPSMPCASVKRRRRLL